MDFPPNITTKLDKLLTESEWKHCILYGGSKRLDILPCKRIKDYKKCKPKPNVLRTYGINWGGETLEAYQCSFIKYYKTIPNIVVNWNDNNDDIECKNTALDENTFETISHICLSPSVSGINPCIEPTHMELETIRDNNDRRNCHHLIKMYESKMRWKGEIPIGPIFVDDLSQDDKFMIAKTMHISNKRKESMKYYHCNHWPSCFVNYGEIKQQ